jgi:hypothetical protein
MEFLSRPNHDPRKRATAVGAQEEAGMRIHLRLHKEGASLCEGVYDVSDADSFGTACADVWNRLRERKLATVTSIGALFDELDERLVDDLYGAEIRFSKP